MKTLIALMLLIPLSRPVFAQDDLRSYVNNNAKAITTINPESADFADLAVIGNAIGDARIVMLGEQDHGDAPAFEAKTRLINYLHTEKGFEVIAFESDFFSATDGFEKSGNSGSGFAGYYKANLFPYWTLCDACNSLFTKIIPQSLGTEKPLILAGFDSQMYLRYSYLHLAKVMDSMARQLDLEIVHDDPKYKEMISTIEILSNQLLVISKSQKFYEDGAVSLQLLKKQFEGKVEQNSIWLVLLDNLVTTCYQVALKDKDFIRSCNYRDIQMAANLKWLCNIKYPDKKIIVWAANYHISKYTGHFSKKGLNESISMASVFVNDPRMDAQTYSIGFASYDGEAGRIGTKAFRIDEPGNNGFENWIDKSIDYSFADFKGFNLANPDFNKEFSLKSSVSAQGVHKNHDALWNRMFDGIFFIRHMYPCKIKY